jgi:hypothetical protein
VKHATSKSFDGYRTSGPAEEDRAVPLHQSFEHLNAYVCLNRDGVRCPVNNEQLCARPVRGKGHAEGAAGPPKIL